MDAAALRPCEQVAVAGKRARHPLVLGLALACVVAGFLGLPPHLINHDVSQFMYGGRAALDGLALYRDFIEMNLPTVYYLSAVPVMLAKTLGMSNATGLYLFVMLLIAASLAGCAWFLENTLGRNRPEILLILLAAMLFPAFRHFGQREHLLCILAFPYLLSFLAPVASRRHRLLVGVLAGFGLCLKPYFLLLPLFMEAAAWEPAEQRYFTGHAQSWGALTTAGLLMAVGLWRHPEYLSDLMPLAQATYGGWDASLSTLFIDERFLLSFCMLWVAVRLPAPVSSQRLRHLLAAATLCGVAIMLSQHKRYDYHYLPAIIPGAALTLLVICDLLRLPLAAKHTYAALPLATLPLSLLTMLVVRDALFPFFYSTTIDQLAPVIHRHEGGRPIAALSPQPFPAFPYLMRHGGQWALRYPSLWPLAKYLRYWDGSEPGYALQQIRTRIIEDMERQAPCVTIVDNQPWASRVLPILDFLSTDPRFVTVWKPYRLVTSIDGYAVYSRCPAAAPPDEHRGFP